MNWNLGNFGFFDADTLKRAALAAGLGAGATALLPEEAEGAVRPDIVGVVSNAIKEKNYKGQVAGTLESPLSQQALANSSKYKGNTGYFTEHGLTWRHESDGWTPEQIAEGYKGIYDSPDTVVIPNVLGQNHTAQEALWNPNGPGNHSWYMPIVPHKKGFKGVTIYDPETSRVADELKGRGYWEGGSTSSIFTPSLEEGLVQPVGSGTLPAVNNGPFNNSLQEQLKKLKLPAVGATSALGSGLAMPEGAQAAGPEMPLSFGEPSQLAGLARQFGLGSRGVLEGLGQGITLGLGDPGKGLSDLMGLPVPQNETEQGRVGLNSALAGVAGTGLLGAGLAKAPGAVVSGIGRGLSSDPVTDVFLTLTDENFDKMLEYGHHVMDLLEQYEDELGDW